MKVWRDYRITIPANIRQKLGLQAGTELDYVAKGDEILLFKKDLPPREQKTVKPSQKKNGNSS